MGDLFWDVATSAAVLGPIGLLLGACLIVGYFPLIRWFPVIGQYVQAARLASIILAATLCFLIGFRVSDEREEAKSLRTQIEAKERDIDTANKVARKADGARALLAKKAEQDQERIEDYEERLRRRAATAGTSNCGCILVPDDFDGVPNNRQRAR